MGGVKSRMRKVKFTERAWCFMVAILSVSALGMNFENTAEEGMGLLESVLTSFEGWGIEAFLLTAGLGYFYNYVFRSFKLQKACVVFGSFLACLMLMGLCYVNATGIALIFLNGGQMIKTLIVLIGYGVLFYCVMVCLKEAVIRLAVEQEDRGEPADKKAGYRYCFKIAAILFVCWLPYLLICYPGTTLYDARTMLEQYFGLSPMTNHHPYFQTVLIGIFVEIGDMFGSGAAGMFLYVLIQEVAFIAVLTYLFVKLKKAGISRKIRIVLLGIYALLPVFPVYAISVGKNMNFSIVLLLITIFLYELAEKEEDFVAGKWKLFFLPVLLVLLCLFRNEGIWIVLGCMPVFLWIGKRHWEIFAAIFAGVVVFAGIWFKGILPAMGVADGSIAESLSIPFLQTARVAAYYGDEATPEEKAAIDAVLEYDTLAERYLPEFSDRVKERYNNDATEKEIKEYLQVYVAQFLKHPVTYIDAFLNKCYGYFWPDDPGRTKAWFVVGADVSSLDEKGFDLYARFPEAVKRLDGLLEAFRQIPLIGYTSSVGFYTWCTFVCAFLIGSSRRKKMLCIFIPAALVLLVCAASPVNAYFRYELPVVFAVPYYAAAVICVWKKEKA